MPNITVRIVDRRWADKAQTREVLTVCHPDTPGCCYETAPCPNTAQGEAKAIRGLIATRRAAGLDYPSQPSPAADTVTV